MTDIGRAGMVMKGDYNSASTYETLDVVGYDNGLYIAKQNVPAGTLPTNTTYWQLAINGASVGVLFHGTLVYDASTNCFPISVVPREMQLCVTARDGSNGSLFTLWYDESKPGFVVGAVISGNAPTVGSYIRVQY